MRHSQVERSLHDQGVCSLLVYQKGSLADRWCVEFHRELLPAFLDVGVGGQAETAEEQIFRNGVPHLMLELRKPEVLDFLGPAFVIDRYSLLNLY